MTKQKLFIFACLTLLLTSCYVKKDHAQPDIPYEVEAGELQQKPAPFAPPTAVESSQAWSKEEKIARAFGNDLDLYRAITAYKRALILLPKEANSRRQEIEYQIIHAYYLGGKYQEAINHFESSSLTNIEKNFAPFHDLVIILHDCYRRLDKTKRMEAMQKIMEGESKEKGKNLKLSTALFSRDFKTITALAKGDPSRDYFLEISQSYKKKSKSIRKAQLFNALLPGAGYYYVEQKRSAFTAFLLNSLFIAAAHNLFKESHTAAAVIVTSLELGWYFGGINGAGLAAREYNERLYESYGKKMLHQEKLHPIMMLHYAF